jgi:Uma2 family endonuclease
MSDDQFFYYCKKNEPYQVERNSLGEIIVMEPTWSETGRCNFDIATELGIWNKEKKLGYAFDSSAGFTLANSAIRAADAAFIKKERWNQIRYQPANARNSHAFARTLSLKLYHPLTSYCLLKRK